MIIPEGNATIAIPTKEESIAIILPTVVTAYISPYPTVVSETVAQYSASKKVLKVSGSTLKMISAVVRIYPIL